MDHPNQERHEDLGPGGDERRQADRRQGDRRHSAALGGRRHQEDRRRRDRRMKLAGAGLLASLAFAVGGHQMHLRMAPPGAASFVPAGDVPEGSVDVDTQYRMPVWDKAALEPIIQEAAAVHGLPAALIRAVIQTESQFNPMAVSRVGAQGLMQLMPKTARHVGIENPFDPRENVLGGTKYLSTLLERFKGNTARALAAYNAGPTTVSRYRGLPPYRETQGYVRKIHKLVADTDAAFTMPATARVVRKASLRSRASKATARRVAAPQGDLVTPPGRRAQGQRQAQAGGEAREREGQGLHRAPRARLIPASAPQGPPPGGGPFRFRPWPRAALRRASAPP
jgi:hypothetical protein